jgi:cyanate permease
MSMQSIFSSKATWAAIIAIVAAIAGAFGYTFSTEDQETLSTVLASIAGGLGTGATILYKVKKSKNATKATNEDASVEE